MTFALGGNFQLLPELLVVTKGATDQITIGPTTVDETLIFDYFEIPMLMRIPFASGGSVRPSLLVGPALAIKLKSRIEFASPHESLSEDLDNITDTDFGVVFGVGTDLGRGPRGFLLDARYTLGLTDVWNRQSEFDAINTDAFNGVFAVMAGYRF
jgi:hypothetical protein